MHWHRNSKDRYEFPGISLSIRSNPTGTVFLRSEIGSELHSETQIGLVQVQALSTNLLDLANIDEEVFPDSLEASDALKELNHVRDVMIDLVSSDDGFLEGFVDYAETEITDCESMISTFYKKLTQRTLETHRVR
jgi:hypothetical protein